MNNGITIGCDPGQKGAIAFLQGKCLLDVFDIPFISVGPYRCVSRDEIMFKWINCAELCNAYHCIIEKPMPLCGEGVTTAFTSGLGFGGLVAALQELCPLGVTIVTAQKWKKAMGCTADKETSMREAVARFPEHKEKFYGPRGGLKDGRAEGALIGLYGATHLWCE